MKSRYLLIVSPILWFGITAIAPAVPMSPQKEVLSLPPPPLREPPPGALSPNAEVQPPGPDAGLSADELAKKLSNPVSSLISVPFQSNWDFGYDDDAFQYRLNFQPVVPVSLNEDWNLICRAIVPFIHQENVLAPDTEQTGLSDTLTSFFLSPAEPTESGVTWGLGPVFLLPTATDDLLSSEQWGAGPTVVMLRQQGKLTYGLLANHVWGFGGQDDRADVNSTFLQPFFSLGAGKGATVSLNTESSYNWEAEQWTIPINLFYSKVFEIGKQKMQWQLGGRAYLERPDGGPDWGIRAGLTFLFPR